MPDIGRRHATSAHPPVAAAAPDRSTELRAAIDACGWHPEVVAAGMHESLAHEPVRSFVVHHEPTFDRDEVRRHVTVVALTPTRLVVGHTDEHPPDDLLPAPYTSTTTEAVGLGSVQSVVVNRMVAHPERYARTSVPAAAVQEVVVTIAWGAVGRIDLEPASCEDPECDGDHGYSGTMTSDDFSIRVSATADGADAVDLLLAFARDLSAATAR
jgi:hypothetical protein